MNKSPKSQLTDKQLWARMHQLWPGSEESCSMDQLAAYLEGNLETRKCQDLETALSRNPVSLETYASMLQLHREGIDEEPPQIEPIQEMVERADSSWRSLGNSASDDSNKVRWLAAAALAASLLAVFLGVTSWLGSDMKNQLVMAKSSLVDEQLRIAQISTDLAGSGDGPALWLGNPSAWFGYGPPGTVRGNPDTLPEGVNESLADQLATMGQRGDLTDEQKLWLAELLIAGGAMDSAAALLSQFSSAARTDRWQLITATLDIKKALTASESAILVSEDAVSTLLRLAESDEFGSQANFQLAVLRLREGKRLLENDFLAARESLSACIIHIDAITNANIPPSVKQAALQIRKQAEALRKP